MGILQGWVSCVGHGIALCFAAPLGLGAVGTGEPPLARCSAAQGRFCLDDRYLDAQREAELAETRSQQDLLAFNTGVGLGLCS